MLAVHATFFLALATPGHAEVRSVAPAPAVQPPILRAASGQADGPTLAGLPVVGQWGGSGLAVAGDGSIGFVAGAHFIETIDLAADPPHAIGRRIVADPISTIAVRDGRLYAAADRTLIVLDAQRPERLSEVGRFELPSPPMGSRRRWIAYLAPGDGVVWLDVATQQPFELPTHTLTALDVTNPERIRAVGAIPIERPREVAGLWRVGDRLIAATVTTGAGIAYVTHVDAFDVRDPASVRLIGEVGPLNTISGSALYGSRLVLAVSMSPQLPELSAERTTGLRVLDVSAADGPTIVGRWDASEGLMFGYGIEVVGDVAFVGVYDSTFASGGGCTVRPFDMRSMPPTARPPLPCAALPPLGLRGHVAGGRWLATVGGDASAYGRTEATVWEAWSTAGDAPRLLARGAVSRHADDVVGDGRRLLVLDYVLGIDRAAARLLEPIGDAWREQVVTLDLAGDAFPSVGSGQDVIALAADRAVVVGYDGAVVFDLSSEPARRVSEVPWSALASEGPQLRCESAALVGGMVVLDLESPGFGFTLLDLSDPAHPARVATPWDGLEVTDMAVDRDRLFVAASWHLFVFVPGGPLGLRLAGEWGVDDGEGAVVRVAAGGRRAVLAGDAALVLLDVADPAAIRVAAERRGDELWSAAVVGEDVVAVARRPGQDEPDVGMVLLRGDDLSEVAWRRDRDLASRATVASLNGRLYVATYRGLLAYGPWRIADGWRPTHRLALPWLRP